MQEGTRFDDLVRSERYFTATLLPSVLLHNGLSGLDPFLRLVERAGRERPNGPTEHDRAGQLVRRAGPTPTWSKETVELIAEFHISRDLTFAGKLSVARRFDPPNGEDRERWDAPDLVIGLDGEMLACEAKFFADFNVPKLNQQLRSQRSQLTHLLKLRPTLRAYRQVAILPEVPREQVDADAVLLWKDVATLADSVLGEDDYVTRRFKAAVKLYESQYHEPGIRNYDGVMSLEDMLHECQKRGDAIEVGHIGGRRDLLSKPPEYLRRKRWKWRDRVTNRGKVVRGNWLLGTVFLSIAGGYRIEA